MKTLNLQQKNVAQGEQQPSPCGRSLSSNYAPLNLENKFLTQKSTVMPQPCSNLLNHEAQPPSSLSCQSSSLSSTSSSLLRTSLCSSSLTSPLLSTENKLLTSHSVFTTSSCLTTVANEYLVSTSLPSTAMLDQFVPPEDGEENSEVKQLCLEERNLVNKTFFIDLLLFYCLVMDLYSF